MCVQGSNVTGTLFQLTSKVTTCADIYARLLTKPLSNPLLGSLSYSDTQETIPMNSAVYEIDYFCLTAEVDESAKNWIRLYSSVMPEGHTGEERIIVEDGKIYIKVLPNVEADSRNGIVYLTTMVSSVKTGISNVQRIKIDVTQLGQ